MRRMLLAIWVLSIRRRGPLFIGDLAKGLVDQVFAGLTHVFADLSSL